MSLSLPEGTRPEAAESSEPSPAVPAAPDREAPPAPPSEVPICTLALIAANVLAFAAMVAQFGTKFMAAPDVPMLLKSGADYAPLATTTEPWRVLTSMFVHVGTVHILMNMAVLFDIGRAVEAAFGRARFLTLYFLAGVTGACASLAWKPNLVSAGASGAIFGVVGGMVALAWLRRDVVPPEYFRKHMKSLLAFVGYNVFYGLLLPNIDNAAHMGGLAAGLVAGLGFAPRPGARLAGVRAAAAAALLLAASGLAFARASHSPEVTNHRKVESYNAWVTAARPQIDAQDQIVKEFHALREKNASEEEWGKFAARSAEKSEAHAAGFRAARSPDPEVAALGDFFVVRAEHLTRALRAIEKMGTAQDVAAQSTFKDEFAAFVRALDDFHAEKLKFGAKYSIKF